MPLAALSAKASEIVPVGAIDSRWLLRMPCWRMASILRDDARRSSSRHAGCAGRVQLVDRRRGGMIVSFILGTILFVILIGLLDARLIPWPKPSPAAD